MKAAVFYGVGKPLQIEEIDIDAPHGREVLVRLVASGVCHSDLHVVEGKMPFPPPIILGHEPAGIVEAVGEDVTDFAPATTSSPALRFSAGIARCAFRA